MVKDNVYSGMKVTVMGLGLNGGGLESARYLAQRGAECTITDMKDEETLRPSIEQLEALTFPHVPFRYVLGRHEIDDFKNADMVIKNPGVRPDSPYLAAARHIETDIGLFLAASPARLCAVTGSKGKSVTSSVIHWVLAKAREAGIEIESGVGTTTTIEGKTYLGGNITVSPLSFLDELTEKDDVVLELSSWQLRDIKSRKNYSSGFLRPRTAVLTSIMPDHQDYYGSMEAYVNDKCIIYEGQDKTCATIACADDEWGQSFLAETPGRPLSYSEKPQKDNSFAGIWLDPAFRAGMVFLDGNMTEIVPPNPLVPGRHQKKNLLAAAAALLDLGLSAPFIRESLGSFPGIEHRLEFFHEMEGIRFYNDTAATIPEAAAAAIEALIEAPAAGTKRPLVFVTGGTDKNLDFSPLVKAAAAAKDIILLAGTGSDKLIPLLKEAGLSFHGPCGNINDAAQTAISLARKASGQGGKAAVILSPGCASFGMFRNEFDRGRQWKEAVRRQKTLSPP